MCNTAIFTLIMPSFAHHGVSWVQIGFVANGKGIRDLVHNWVGSFFSIATLFKRLDNEGTYIREMQVLLLGCLMPRAFRKYVEFAQWRHGHYIVLLINTMTGTYDERPPTFVTAQPLACPRRLLDRRLHRAITHICPLCHAPRATRRSRC